MSFGPVSNTLIGLLRERMASGHRIYTWLDPDSTYKDFIQKFVQSEHKKCHVIAFDGSYLEMMVQIDQLLGGVTPPPSIIYLPNHNRKRAEDSPMLEMLLAGKEMTIEFSSLLRESATGFTTIDDVETFLTHQPYSLEDADQWLQEAQQENSGQFWTQLHNLSTATNFIQALIPSSDPENLHIPDQFRLSENQETFWRYVEIQFGIPKDWEPRRVFEESMLPNKTPDFYDLLYVISSWAFVVEFVDDLGNIPLPKELQQIPMLNKKMCAYCNDFAQTLRDVHPTFYKTLAHETEKEECLASLRNTPAYNLGLIDTFAFEERAYFEGVIKEITDTEDFKRARDWAQTRLKNNSFWIQQDGRHETWRIFKKICQLGEALQQAPYELPMMNSVDEAADFYVHSCTPVDKAHRHFEQVVAVSFRTSNPDYNRIQKCIQTIRDKYTVWLDSISRSFNALCLQHGFLPAENRQQRNIFHQVVKPLCKNEKTAFFMVDALRFEMAQELQERMDLQDTDTVWLKPYFCELPSNTNVGMNLLAPATQGGQIELVMSNDKIQCIQSNTGYQIRTPENRRFAIKEAIGGQSSPQISIQEIFESTINGLRKKFSHSSIIVVPYVGIDKAGENNEGPNKFSDALRILRKAWERLREVGITQFVFVSDHGFLLVDPNPNRANRQEHGRPIDNNRRHIITKYATNHPNEVRVRLRDLNYIVEEDYHLIMPEDAKLFENGFSGRNFAHGGNSLQERIIPVLQIVHGSKIKTKEEKYEAKISPFSTQSSLHGITLHIESDANSLSLFAKDAEIELRAVDQVTAQVQIIQVLGGGTFNETKVEVKPDKDVHILFRIYGTSGTSRIEVRFPNRGIEAITSKQYFDVEGKDNIPLNNEEPRIQNEEPVSANDWLNNIEDTGARQIFAYLVDHQVLSEADATNFLGGARQFRRFKIKFSEYQTLIPFNVRIEVVGGLSQFVRE